MIIMTSYTSISVKRLIECRKLEKFRFKKEIGKNWFTNRVVDEQNRLNSHVVSAKSIDCFKNRLDKFMDSDDSKQWVFLGSQELPRVGQLTFCSLLIFLCNKIIVFFLCDWCHGVLITCQVMRHPERVTQHPVAEFRSLTVL